MKHRSRYADDKDIGPILPGFLARLSENLKTMRAARSANDPETLRRLAHQIKGAGASYGFPELSGLASLIESEVTATKSLDSAASHLHALIVYAENIENYPA